MAARELHLGRHSSQSLLKRERCPGAQPHRRTNEGAIANPTCPQTSGGGHVRNVAGRMELLAPQGLRQGCRTGWNGRRLARNGRSFDDIIIASSSRLDARDTSPSLQFAPAASAAKLPT